MRHAEPCLGGFVPFSSVDWPDALSAVVFVKGCPWRCHYCHNPHLQTRGTQRTIDIVLEDKRKETEWKHILSFLESRKKLLDGVVFSGGEPFSEPLLDEMIGQVVALGYRVAVHTAGIYPQKLERALPALSWVGLDVKTDAHGYDALTGRAASAQPVWRCLDSLLESQVPFECRTTWSPEWLTESALIDLAQGLSRKGVRKYAVQRYRSPAHRVVEMGLSAQSMQTLNGLFEQFSYR